MHVIINEKTYALKAVKSRILRKAIALKEDLDVSALKTTDLDKMMEFFCEAFGNQFTIDDVYDGLDANKLLPTISGTIQHITESMGK